MWNPFVQQERYWQPYVSPFDPCHPIRVKKYVVPPNQYIPFQPPIFPSSPLKWHFDAVRCGRCCTVRTERHVSTGAMRDEQNEQRILSAPASIAGG